MRYFCLVYEDGRRLTELSATELAALRDESGAHFLELQNRRQLLGIDDAGDPVRLRVRNGLTVVGDDDLPDGKAGPGRCTLIEARDLSDAIRLAARTPMARYGYVELRALQEPGGVL